MKFSCLYVSIVFVFVVHDKRICVTCQFSASIRYNHHGPYTVGQTYHGTCYVKLSAGDNITNVDVYWDFGNINYCHNDQKIWRNKKYTCDVNTAQNNTYFDLKVPDLTLDDSGIYSCRVNHNTRGHKTTFRQTVSVVETPILTTDVPDITGGSTSVYGNVLSIFLIMLAASLIHS